MDLKNSISLLFNNMAKKLDSSPSNWVVKPAKCVADEWGALYNVVVALAYHRWANELVIDYMPKFSTNDDYMSKSILLCKKNTVTGAVRRQEFNLNYNLNVRCYRLFAGKCAFSTEFKEKLDKKCREDCRQFMK